MPVGNVSCVVVCPCLLLVYLLSSLLCVVLLVRRFPAASPLVSQSLVSFSFLFVFPVSIGLWLRSNDPPARFGPLFLFFWFLLPSPLPGAPTGQSDSRPSTHTAAMSHAHAHNKPTLAQHAASSHQVSEGTHSCRRSSKATALGAGRLIGPVVKLKGKRARR